MKKRIALLCALFLVFSAFPIVAGAEEFEIKDGDLTIKYTVEDGKATIDFVWLTETWEELVVPAELDGYPVVKVAVNALGNIRAERVVFAEGIEVLGNCLFEQSGVKEVVLPASVRVMEDNVFSNCSGLERVEFAEGLETVDGGIFYNCPKITQVELPRSLRTVKGALFNYCESVTEIDIPEGVESIGLVAQDCRNLERVHLPASLKTAPQVLFWGCVSVKEVTVAEGCAPLCVKNNCVLTADGGVLLRAMKGAVLATDGSLKAIATGAFSGADWLTEIVIPDSVTEIGTRAFSECAALKRVAFPSGLKEICRGVFISCPSLETVVLPDGLETIGSHAFAHTALKEIVIPDSVTSLGENAFWDCGALERAVLSKGLTEIETGTFDACDSLREVIIPEGVKKLDVFAFYARNLERIVIPSTLTQIYGRSFATSKKTIEVTVSADNPVYYADGACLMDREGTLVKMLGQDDIPAQTTAIGAYAFFGNELLKAVQIPDGVTSIGSSAFWECTELQEVIIPESVTELGSNAFSDCKKLASVSLPDTLKTLGSSAFSGCELLSSIDLPDGLEYIGSHAFNKTKISSLYIPASVREVGGTLFYTTETITSISFGGNEKPEGWNEFDYDYRGCKYHMNVKRGEKRESVAENGIAYELGDGVAVVTGLLADASHDVVIPETVRGCVVTEIAERAFKDTDIFSIYLPDTVTVIRESAFEDCTNLSSVRFPLLLVTLEKHAFDRCFGLDYAYLAETVTTVGYNALADCLVIECEAEAEPEGWTLYWHNRNAEIRWGVEPLDSDNETSIETSDESSKETSEESTDESTEPSETPTVSVSEETPVESAPSAVPSESTDVSEEEPKDGVSPVVWVVVLVALLAGAGIACTLVIAKRKKH